MRLGSTILLTLIVVATVEWSFIAYAKGLIEPSLAVTLIVVEVPSELALAWVISKLLDRPDELARRFAEEKQKLEDGAKIRDGIQAKRLAHYADLEPVFSLWSNLTYKRQEATATHSWDALAATTFYAWNQMQGSDHFHGWAFEHVNSGYSELQGILDRLKALEYDNNVEALVISTNIDDELNNVLRTFSSLSSSRAMTERNFYVLDQVKHAVYYPDVLTIWKAATYSEEPLAFSERMDKVAAVAGQFSLSLNGEQVARSERPTIDKLVNEIGKLRTAHLGDFQGLRDNENKHAELLFLIRKKTTEIVHDIKYVKKLEGQCALCKRFS